MKRLFLSSPTSNVPPYRTIVVVHGFGFDVADPAHDPNIKFSPQFQKIFVGRGVQGFNYYSVPFGIKHLWRSWKHGRFNRYRYAWDLAEEAGVKLRQYINTRFLSGSGEVDLVGHSLGARVIASALDGKDTPPVNRVLLLNGAEHVSRYVRLLDRLKDGIIRPEFLNISVQTDDVLHKLGSLMSPGRFYESCIGQSGLMGCPINKRWMDIQLDNPYHQEIGKEFGWTLRGDNPGAYGDHWYSFKHDGNWDLYRKWLDGSLRIG